MRSPVSRIAISHASGEDLGRDQRDGSRLRFRSIIGLDRDCLEGKPGVMDGEDRTLIPA